MKMINFIDLVLPSFDAVRTASDDGCPDVRDCHEVVDAQFAAIKQNLGALKEGRVVILDPSAIAAQDRNYVNFDPRRGLAASRGTSVGVPGLMQSQAQAQANLAAGNCAPYTQRDGGTPGPLGCASVVHCGATPLGFNTFGNADYPLTGAVLGTISNGELIEVTSGRAKNYRPLWLFMSVRDQGNGMARIQGFLTRASVQENSQLAGDSNVNRPIDSDIFDNVGPLPLDNWASFTNTSPQTLSLGFGHAFGPSVDAQFSGAFWGEATYQ